MISGFPTQLPAMQPTLPRLHQSTTLPVHTPTFQIYHPAQFPVPPTVPTLQPPYSGGRFQEMFPEQLPSIPPIEPALFPYHAQPHMPRSTVLHSKQSEFHPVVRSTPAHQVEGSIAAAPSLQHSTPIGPLDTLWTTVPATSPHTTYTDTPLQGKHTVYTYYVPTYNARAMKILYHPNVCPFTQQMVCMLDCSYISFFCMFRITPAQEDIPDSGQTQV